MPTPTPSPDEIRRRLATGFYNRPDAIARIAEAMLPALTGEGGTPAPARQPRRSSPPPSCVRLGEGSLRRRQP